MGVRDSWEPDTRLRMGARPEIFDPDPRVGPEKEAARITASFAEDGQVLVLTPDTLVVPDGHGNTLNGTWGDIEALVRQWARSGCEWVNLCFYVETDGRVVVR
jgi:hypothetical protein